VTVFGVLDATVTKLTAKDAGSVTIMDGSGRNQSSRLGFRGTEDLGGGLSAAFWLEAAINVDNGTGSNSTINNTSAGDRVTLNSSGANMYNPQSTLGARQGLTFNRASTVSLISKDLGEVRLGRDYNPAFWNYTVYDPFGAVGVGSALNVIGGPLAPVGIQAFPPGAAYPMVRTSNSISWLSSDMGGFRAQLQYALSEQPTNCATPLTNFNSNSCWGASGDGKLLGTRLSYAQGPLSAALAYSKTTYGNVASAGGTLTTQGASTAGLASTAAYRGDYTQMNLGGAYDLGMAKLFAQYGTQNYAASGVASEKKQSHYLLGAAVPMGSWTHKVTYNAAKRDDAAGTGAEIGSKGTQFALGTQYDFSKRTAVYATYSSNKLTAGTTTAGALRVNLGLAGNALAAGTSATATGIDIGIRHAF
jgi:predicted porin